MGPSYSGPVVASDRVFTTETVGKKTEVVRAYDRSSGHLLWKAEWPGAMSVPFFAASNGSWIRSTPVVDGEFVYVAGMRDVLVCLNVATGQEVWRRDLMAEFNTPLPAFGFVASPLIHGEFLFVQAGGGVVKLNKRTGEVLWRSLEDGGGMYGSAFSSPIIVVISGVEQLIIQTREQLAGVDPESGAVLWKQEVPAFRGMNILTPTVYDGAIFTSSYGGAAYLFRPSLTDGKWSVRQVWESRMQGYMSSPILIGDYAYLHLKNQRFTCVDLRTGEQTWTSKPYGKYWSLIADGERILALDERGDLLLISADPKEFRLLESRHITDESSWAHLALSEGQLFVRSLDRLTMFRESASQSPATH